MFFQSSFLPFTAISRRYLTALSIIAALAIATFLALSYLIKVEKEYASIINVSGKQRMMSQRIAKLSLHYSVTQDETQKAALRARLVQTIHDTQQVHTALTHMPLPMLLHRVMSSQLHSIYFDAPHHLDQQVRAYLHHAMQ